MRNLAELKRYLVPGVRLKLIFRFGKYGEKIRPIHSVQTNGLYFLTDEGTKSWLGFPPASLLEVSEKGFTIFNPGYRPLTEEEKAIREGYELIRDQRQEDIDALTDGNVSYWRRNHYFRKNNALYLIGSKEQRGMRYDSNKELVRDNRIKGEKVLSYEFVKKEE